MNSVHRHIKSADSKVIKDLSDWILTTLSRSEEALNHLPPCPYAREALLKRDLEVFEPQSDVEAGLLELLENYPTYNKKVLILSCEKSQLSLKETEDLVLDIRQQYSSKNLWLMYDHPLEEEKVGDIDFSNGNYLLFFVQYLSDLIQKSSELSKSGYYKNWPAEYYSQVVQNRSLYSEGKKAVANVNK